MPYITCIQPPRCHQVTLEEILAGEITSYPTPHKRPGATVTVFTDKLTDKVLRSADVPSLIVRLTHFNAAHEALLSADKGSLYETFHIPKRTGGLRRIDAPNEELSLAQRELKSIFESDFHAMHHTSAFAYVPGRCTIDAVKKHQLNQSRWFLKTDFSNFFGSTTPEFVFRMLSMIFPFSEVVKDEVGAEALRKSLSLCFLNGGLPQGTPISPMLTNLMMIPFDHAVSNTLSKQRMVYSRYADDIQISSRYSFDYQKTVRYLDEVLRRFSAPFEIKAQKTHYGSRSGHNFMLGACLNQENRITRGWREQDRLRAMFFSYAKDRMNGTAWDPHDLQVLKGNYAYSRMVDPEGTSHIINRIDQKLNSQVLCWLDHDLKGGMQS